ncbi:MAG: hypothetical protein IPK07_04325 [Deltaproteobacteria bacterium]|nr:hypothetical protein [Deltaproteobacteria bacterium]
MALAEGDSVVEIELERRESGLRPGDVYAGRLRRVVPGSTPRSSISATNALRIWRYLLPNEPGSAPYPRAERSWCRW